MMEGMEGRGEARGPGSSNIEDPGENPNQYDLPQRPTGHVETRDDDVPNVWWSDWANDAFRIQQMRPEDLANSLGQSSHYRTSGSDGVAAAQGNEGQNNQGPQLGSATNSLGEASNSNVAAAATEMIRQTSIGHYEMDLAETFLREQSGIRQQEPEYFRIGSQRSTPEGSQRQAVREADPATFATASENRMWARGTEDVRSQSSEGIVSGLQALSLQARDNPLGMDGRSNAALRSRTQVPTRESVLEEATRSMPVRDMYSVFESQGENHPWVDALLPRLEQAETRSRSTASYHSAVELMVAGLLREGSDRPLEGMCQGSFPQRSTGRRFEVQHASTSQHSSSHQPRRRGMDSPYNLEVGMFDPFIGPPKLPLNRALDFCQWMRSRVCRVSHLGQG